MNDYYFWVSTRRIKPDARELFEHSWRPTEFPDGLVGAYVLEERSSFYTGRELESQAADWAFRAHPPALVDGREGGGGRR